MAVASYYTNLPQGEHHEDTEHLLSPKSTRKPSHQFNMSHPTYPASTGSSNSTPLKPYHLSQPMDGLNELRALKEEDQALKARIRRLRAISRILALFISISVFIPITLTLHKFLSTKNIHRPVRSPDGSTTSRTPWARDSKVWPTWIYFLVAALAVLLHSIILVSYFFSVRYANRSAIVTAVFTWGVMLGNLVVWSVAAGIYRREKDLNGKSNDLWGWTCSSAAQEIQEVFVKEVDFGRFCDVQSASWYAGLVQVGAAALTIFIYFLVVRRKKSKKRVAEGEAKFPGAFEAVRY